MSSTTPDRLCHRRSSHLRRDAGAEMAATPAVRSSSRHDGTRLRSSSVRPSTGGNPEPQGRGATARAHREVAKWCGDQPVAILVGTLVAAVLCARFLLAVPADALSRLGPEKVVIKAAPFPLADLVTISELYANASDDFFFPERNSNITLALDAPGLVPINIASWLPRLWFEVLHSRYGTRKRRVPAEKVPFLINYVNTSLTPQMADGLWPVLIYAATDLLVAGLGRDHPEYPSLRAPLVELLANEWLSATRMVVEMDKFLADKSRDWNRDATHAKLMEGLQTAGSARARAAMATAKDTSGSGPSQLVIGSQVPTFEQLLHHDGGRQQPLPRLLARSIISADAFSQLRVVHDMLSWHYLGRDEDKGLGMDGSWSRNRDIVGHGLCPAYDLVHAVAESRCRGTRLYMSVRDSPSVTDRKSLAGLWDALCDAESLLSRVQGLAEGVRDRVGAAVEERGGLSTRERFAGYLGRDGIVRRTATLNRALHALYPLRSALGQQRRMLTSLATKMRRACTLQDELRQHVRALYHNASDWWRVEWDDARETAELTFVTFPAMQDTITQLRAAMDRIAARDEPLKRRPEGLMAFFAIKKAVLTGWLERLGLDGLPLEDQMLDSNLDIRAGRSDEEFESRRARRRENVA